MAKNNLDTDSVKRLREISGAGIMDCKDALSQAGGDIEKATAILRKKGIEMATKKASREAKEGRVEAYIHHGGKIGVLVEVNCETDFVARNDDFRNFMKDVAMQIAALGPRYISREEVPVEVLEAERQIAKEQMNPAPKSETKILRCGVKGKPQQAVEKAIPGKLEKFYQQVCLLEQPFIKDEKVFIKDLLASLIGKIGENISIKRFVRFQVGVQ
jgi:elongation factor Ts